MRLLITFLQKINRDYKKPNKNEKIKMILNKYKEFVLNR